MSEEHEDRLVDLLQEIVNSLERIERIVGWSYLPWILLGILLTAITLLPA